MFGMGMPEMLLILAVALIVIGPKKLPDLARSLGRTFGEFKRATNDLKESLEIDTDLRDVSNTFDNVADEIKDSVAENADEIDPIQTDSALQDDEEDLQETEKKADPVKGPETK